MNDKRGFSALELKGNFVFSQVTLDCCELLHSDTFNIDRKLKKLNRYNGYTLTFYVNQCRIRREVKQTKMSIAR
jgi:hypothetical protein